MNMQDGTTRHEPNARPRRGIRVAGWVLLLAGALAWAGLMLTDWLAQERTVWWLATTVMTVGLVLLLASTGYEQYRDWKDTRYKDVHR